VQATEHPDGSMRAVQLLPAVRARHDVLPLVVPVNCYFMPAYNRDSSEEASCRGGC
jgi:hypothetical protein